MGCTCAHVFDHHMQVATEMQLRLFKLTLHFSQCNKQCELLSLLFTVASLGLLPVILSGIKYCDSQEGSSVSNTVKRSKAACVGNNSIIQTTHKTMHITSTQVIKSSLLYSMQQKAGEKSGNKARLSHSPSHFISILL